MGQHVHAKVQNYIKKNCATYDRNGLCLLETDSCGNRLCPLLYNLGKVCNYAETSVIPGNSEIEALYLAGRTGADPNVHNCERCKKPYTRNSNRQIRCVPCAEEVRKSKRILYDAKYRSK